MKKYKLLYKNFFGEFNILITETLSQKIQQYNPRVLDIREIYDAHLWINDNIVCKDFTGKELFLLNEKISDSRLTELFGNAL